MLFSRVWYLVLGIIIGGTLFAITVAQRVSTRLQVQALDSAVVKDRKYIEAILKIESRDRLDLLLRATTDPLVSRTLAIASQPPPLKIEELSRTLGPHLETINNQFQWLKGDLFIALNKDGKEVTSIGLHKSQKIKCGLYGFPLVKIALQGYLKDDTWILNNNLYRMAARPVIYQGEIVGAIVHGIKFDRELAQRLKQGLETQAEIVFFFNNKVFASSFPQENIALISKIEASLAEIFQPGKVLDPSVQRFIQITKDHRGLFSLIKGQAAFNFAGYGIIFRLPLLESDWGLLLKATQKDLKIESPLLWQILFIIIFVSALGILLNYWECSRPLNRLVRSIEKLAKEEIEQIPPSGFRRGYLKIIKRVNEIVQRRKEKEIPREPKVPSEEIAPQVPEIKEAIPKEEQRVEPEPITTEELKEKEVPLAAKEEISAEATKVKEQEELETYIKEVYEEFIKVREECRDSSPLPSYEKFERTLKKNREALMARFDCEEVQFKVHIREGKAIIKAVPVAKRD
jgi:hypothetical protein